MPVISITILGDQEEERAIIVNEQTNELETTCVCFSEMEELELTIKEGQIIHAEAILNQPLDNSYINLANIELGPSQKAYINNHKNHLIVIIDIEALRQDTLISKTYAREYRLDYSKNSNSDNSIIEKRIKLKLNKTEHVKELQLDMKLIKTPIPSEPEDEIEPIPKKVMEIEVSN